MKPDVAAFLERGYARFAPDPGLTPWLDHATPRALACAEDPGLRAAWLRHGGTWFAGVNVLPNDAEGRVAGGPALAGRAIDMAVSLYGSCPLDPAQVSVCYPGYPRRDIGESVAAHGFRARRDAAHVDGLLPVGPERRRMMQEPHAFVLGLPLGKVDAGASPLVVWEGSHRMMRAAFAGALSDVPAEDWAETDLTDVYHDARRRAFDTCQRVELPGQRGESHLLHRLTLHGVAPWEPGAAAPPEGRAIVYFRPVCAGGPQAWLTLD
ncbi:MAG: hypothetical protein AAGF74_07290 [Pseudomonadota bacterium]